MKFPSLTLKPKPAVSVPNAQATNPSAAADVDIWSQIPEFTPKLEIKNVGEAINSAMSPLEIIAPPKIEIDFDYVKIGDVYLRTIFIAGYPRFVSPGWLEPIVNFDHSLDLSFFIFPVEGRTVLDDLRRKIAEMGAELSTDLERGRVLNPMTQAKLEDALSLQEQLVKGIERFFEFSFYITISSNTVEDLNNLTRRVESTLGSLLVVAKHATLDMQNGFLSTSPFGYDRLSITRNMDSTSLATTFPFTTAELSSDTGILYGINSQNESFIIFDRFSLENSNMTIFATSGAGKSIAYNDNVLYDDGAGTRTGKIGQVVESILSRNSIIKLDTETEGVIKPNLKVFSFDKDLKGKWAQVDIAARKTSPKTLFKVTTKSGREITITKDHNLVTLKGGELITTKGSDAQIGDFIPLPRKIEIESESKTNTSDHFLTLLGFITSEGHVRKNIVSITNENQTVLENIKRRIEACGFKASPFYKDSSKKSVDGYYVRPGPIFAKKIIDIGAAGDSGSKRVPGFVLGLSKEQIAYYLRAYFEGNGGVENHEITATTKSKELSSDLAYLLLRFGIIARIKTRKKAATNIVAKQKRTYYRVSISGQDHIRKFIKDIGFITKEKNQKSRMLLKKGNTNVDLIPEIGNVFKEIYKELYNSENPAPKKFSEIKLGIFKPSPKNLISILEKIDIRIKQIEALEGDGLSTLSTLPTIKSDISSRLKTVLGTIQTTHNYNYSAQYVGGAIYRSFKETGVSLQKFDKSLWESVVLGNVNPEYDRVINARDFIVKQYQAKKERLKEIKNKVAWLTTLAKSDLFWDPIVKIKKIKAKHKYVYDLQVENAVFLAGHAGLFVHNSFFVKLECLRSLMLGAEIMVIDPENEYKTLCEAVGGEYIAFSFSSPAKINPFDLSTIQEAGENQLGLKILSLHSLFKVIMGTLSASQEALLDRAIINAYRAKGITQDPDTQTKEPPLMEDLYKALIGMETSDAMDLAARLEKFVKGSYVGVFDQHTNVDLKNPFTVFSVRDLQDSLRPIAMFIILDYIWTTIRKDVKKRLLVVDEAWHMMRYQDTAQFLWSIVKRARKYYLGLTTITQDVEDFLSQDIGKAIVTNSAMRMLLKQSPAAIDRVSEIFYLSQGERQLLLSANVGEGILFAGPHHAPIKVVASQSEYQFLTTRPQDIIKEPGAVK